MFSYVGYWHLVKVVYKKDTVIKNICLGYIVMKISSLAMVFFCLLANSFENLLKRMDV
jgi:hypothetical protein